MSDGDLISWPLSIFTDYASIREVEGFDTQHAGRPVPLSKEGVIHEWVASLPTFYHASDESTSSITIGAFGTRGQSFERLTLFKATSDATHNSGERRWSIDRLVYVLPAGFMLDAAYRELCARCDYEPERLENRFAHLNGMSYAQWLSIHIDEMDDYQAGLDQLAEEASNQREPLWPITFATQESRDRRLEERLTSQEGAGGDELLPDVLLVHGLMDKLFYLARRPPNEPLGCDTSSQLINLMGLRPSSPPSINRSEYWLRVQSDDLLGALSGQHLIWSLEDIFYYALFEENVISQNDETSQLGTCRKCGRLFLRTDKRQHYCPYECDDERYQGMSCRDASKAASSNQSSVKRNVLKRVRRLQDEIEEARNVNNLPKLSEFEREYNSTVKRCEEQSPFHAWDDIRRWFEENAPKYRRLAREVLGEEML